MSSGNSYHTPHQKLATFFLINWALYQSWTPASKQETAVHKSGNRNHGPDSNDKGLHFILQQGPTKTFFKRYLALIHSQDAVSLNSCFSNLPSSSHLQQHHTTDLTKYIPFVLLKVLLEVTYFLWISRKLSYSTEQSFKQRRPYP